MDRKRARGARAERRRRDRAAARPAVVDRPPRADGERRRLVQGGAARPGPRRRGDGGPGPGTAGRRPGAAGGRPRPGLDDPPRRRRAAARGARSRAESTPVARDHAAVCRLQIAATPVVGELLEAGLPDYRARAECPSSWRGSPRGSKRPLRRPSVSARSATSSRRSASRRRPSTTTCTTGMSSSAPTAATRSSIGATAAFLTRSARSWSVCAGSRTASSWPRTTPTWSASATRTSSPGRAPVTARRCCVPSSCPPSSAACAARCRGCGRSGTRAPLRRVGGVCAVLVRGVPRRARLVGGG